MNVILNTILGKIQEVLKPFTFMVLLIFLLNACSTNENKTKPVISVSILPQKYFVEKIAGDNFEINVLIPPGASPATYDPTPVQIVELANSKIYFKIGHIEFEKNWLDKISDEYPQLNVVDCSTGIELMENQYYDNDHGHQHGFIEPHTWMSPKNVRSIANIIYEALVALNYDQKSYYLKNFNQFISEIDSLDKELSLQLNEIKCRDFIIYHPALTYFAEAYNLNQVSIETEGKSPSAFHIKEIIDLAKSRNIKIVFIQKQFDEERAKTIAIEIGGEVRPIDPLDYNWQDQLRVIAQTFVQVSDTEKNE